MNRLKAALRALTRPLRRKIDAKIDALVFEASSRALRATDGMVFDALNRALAAYEPPTPWVDEVTQVLDAVIAEQFRLQSQVEELERLLQEALAARDGLEVAPGAETAR
jgi:hypothetical protein